MKTINSKRYVTAAVSRAVLTAKAVEQGFNQIDLLEVLYAT